LHPENLSKRVLQPVLKALGINLWDDGFRHSNATALDTLNPPMKLRHQGLGHVDANATMGYTHLVSEADRRLPSNWMGCCVRYQGMRVARFNDFVPVCARSVDLEF
jgi:integrase